jgi:dynein heavy chain
MHTIIFYCTQKKSTLSYCYFYFIYSDFVTEKLGSKYTEGRAVEFAKSFEESGPSSPIFFILSPGVNPLKDVEMHGKKIGFTDDNKNFHNISLGQGQEVVAEKALDIAAKDGHWVILQVILEIISA